MGVKDELYIMSHSFSADRQVQYQNRSGVEEGKASALDFFANIPSAEADIIEAEEREEQAEIKRKFTKLLLPYYKRILTDVEFKFLIACTRENKTPYRVGKSLGINYRNTYDSICRKHEANKDKLTALMRACGYDYRHGLDFLASIRKHLRICDNTLRYARAHREILRERVRIYRETHRIEIAERRKAYYAEHREELCAKRRSEEYRKRERVRQRDYYARNSARIREKARIYRETHRNEILAKRREQYPAYYAKHREELCAKQRVYDAQKRRLKKEAQERAEGV